MMGKRDETTQRERFCGFAAGHFLLSVVSGAVVGLLLSEIGPMVSGEGLIVLERCCCWPMPLWERGRPGGKAGPAPGPSGRRPGRCWPRHWWPGAGRGSCWPW